MTSVVACRVASYGEYHESAWSHLPQIGIHHVEIPAPAADELAATQRKLQLHELTASSVQCRFDVNADDAVDVMTSQLDICKQLSSKFAFASVKVGDGDRDSAFATLRRIGDAAAARDVVVVMETHPDLVTNAAVATASMQAIDHPHIRVNFDTANVSYYTEGATAVGELQSMLPWVGAVHLKDYGGGFKQWSFPTLGKGIVDFPKVVETLQAVGYDGPYTMELEGTKGLTFDEAGRLAYVADSAAYLRSIGLLT